MDRITFESVMEEIKKSLGEARLMKIDEDEDNTNQNTKKEPVGIDPKDTRMTGPDALKGPGGSAAPPVSSTGGVASGFQGAGKSVEKPAAPVPAAPAPSPAPAPAPGKNIGMASQGGSSSYGTSPLNNTPAKPTTPSAPSTGAGTVAKPAAPKPSAPAGVDTASIYKKHGVGGSDEDAGAFHRAEAEIAAARKATPSAPAAKPSTPSAPRPATPSAPSAPRPVSQGGAVPTPAPRPMSSLSASGQAMAKQYSGKVGTDDSGNNPMPAPAPKAAPSTPPSNGVTNTPSAGVDKGDNATQGTSPKGFGSSMTRIPYDPKNPAPSTTTRTPYDPKSPSKSIMRPAAMRENFDQFVKKFLKESK